MTMAVPPNSSSGVRGERPLSRRDGHKLLTLVLFVKSGGGDSSRNSHSRRVLLGRKKRGFGQGFYNGFGGKVEASDASILTAAAREMKEESGLVPTDLALKGVLTFIWDDAEAEQSSPNAQPWDVHVYKCTECEGDVVETDEMAPVWMDVDKVPELYDGRMWEDDQHWHPLFFADKLFRGTFHFEKTTVLKHFTLEEVSEIHDTLSS